MDTKGKKRLLRLDLVRLALGAAILSFVQAQAFAQTPAAAKTSTASVHRLPNGKPDFNGIWQALNTASWDIQAHSGQLDQPPGSGVVEGNEIPYQPWALAKKKENFAKRKSDDLTESKCYMPGVPRITYMPYPFQIAQSSKAMAFSYEFDHVLRVIHMEGEHPDPNTFIDTWMGDSRGHWEGDTLVIDLKNFNDQTWFDHAGNFHSDALHVVERYSLADADHMNYEVTIDDPKVFTRPWKMTMPLYRRIEKNGRLLEYECVFYIQEETYKNAPFKK
jgi:hypothetical protein